jgi:hypothetical protein
VLEAALLPEGRQAQGAVQVGEQPGLLARLEQPRLDLLAALP